jgi:POT family proton-dependent oligopeptide transporter
MSTEIAAEGQPRNTFDLWGHPRQLWMLLLVTVGFNFGFYGFRAYLAPYIQQTLFSGLSEGAALKQADLLTSGFLALMYATPIIGGWVADKILGEARALAISLWLQVLSLFLMAWPSLLGFKTGLALFALSTGLSIPLTVLIGRNYPAHDARREGGYTLFYLAINLGAFVAPWVCAVWVGHRYGYRWGFLAAAVGTAFAALLFQVRHSKLHPVLPKGEHLSGPMSTVWVLAAVIVLVYPTARLLSVPAVLSWAMYGLMGLLVLYFVWSCIRRRNRVQAQRYIALLLLFVALVLFWAFSLQGVTSLNFFARDHVTSPLGFSFTAFQSFNPLYILIFAPVLALLWPWLDRHGKDPSTPRKFGIGLFLVALSYGVTAWAIRQFGGADVRLGWWVLAVCYLLQTIGELALSPIGYSLVGQLAAPEESSLAMGGWFFGVALAYQLAGWIATLTAGGSGSAQTGMAAYGHVYGQLFIVGTGVSLVFLLAAPWIRKLMHGVR